MLLQFQMGHCLCQEDPKSAATQAAGNSEIGTIVQAISTPFGTLCVSSPIRRTPVQSSRGNPPPDHCSGALSYDFNARIQSGTDALLVLGRTICAQYWYRDPAASAGAATSDALRFTIGS